MSKVISSSELESHNSREDVWIALSGKVYNVTEFTDEHPGGGEVIITLAGQDATEPFEDVGHSDEARAQLSALLVGELEASKLSSESVKASSHSTAEKGSNLTQFLRVFGLAART